jgi:hypothetical protein
MARNPRGEILDPFGAADQPVLRCHVSDYNKQIGHLLYLFAIPARKYNWEK